VNFAAKLAAANVAMPLVSLATQTDPVATYFKTASAAGFNSVRVFGHGNGSFQLQTGPGGLRNPELEHVSTTSLGKQCTLAEAHGAR
jgi:hypothetical protein